LCFFVRSRYRSPRRGRLVDPPSDDVLPWIDIDTAPLADLAQTRWPERPATVAAVRIHADAATADFAAT